MKSAGKLRIRQFCTCSQNEIHAYYKNLRESLCNLKGKECNKAEVEETNKTTKCNKEEKNECCPTINESIDKQFPKINFAKHVNQVYPNNNNKEKLDCTNTCNAEESPFAFLIKAKKNNTCNKNENDCNMEQKPSNFYKIHNKLDNCNEPEPKPTCQQPPKIENAKKTEKCTIQKIPEFQKKSNIVAANNDIKKLKKSKLKLKACSKESLTKKEKPKMPNLSGCMELENPCPVKDCHTSICLSPKTPKGDLQCKIDSLMEKLVKERKASLPLKCEKKRCPVEPIFECRANHKFEREENIGDCSGIQTPDKFVRKRMKELAKSMGVFSCKKNVKREYNNAELEFMKKLEENKSNIDLCNDKKRNTCSPYLKTAKKQKYVIKCIEKEICPDLKKCPQPGRNLYSPTASELLTEQQQISKQLKIIDKVKEMNESVVNKCPADLCANIPTDIAGFPDPAKNFRKTLNLKFKCENKKPPKRLNNCVGRVLDLKESKNEEIVQIKTRQMKPIKNTGVETDLKNLMNKMKTKEDPFKTDIDCGEILKRKETFKQKDW